MVIFPPPYLDRLLMHKECSKGNKYLFNQVTLCWQFPLTNIGVQFYASVTYVTKAAVTTELYSTFCEKIKNLEYVSEILGS
ncbi:Hypothetical predicted protein [Podarcis lilfordi]|uniref:Uncharacterized protein n=1 Tax=Podarcis lilfordi TaxID=74358 RepID=A0AA35K9Y7_9SAUR|nr:Hypothetical predicted protein [Podarcis lilfordi]